MGCSLPKARTCSIASQIPAVSVSLGETPWIEQVLFMLGQISSMAQDPGTGNQRHHLAVSRLDPVSLLGVSDT